MCVYKNKKAISLSRARKYKFWEGRDIRYDMAITYMQKKVNRLIHLVQLTIATHSSNNPSSPSHPASFYQLVFLFLISSNLKKLPLNAYESKVEKEAAKEKLVRKKKQLMFLL